MAFSRLRKGDFVLDLGCGAGKDVFFAAQRVGNRGRVIGVDMTPEMLTLARRNAKKFSATTGLNNVEFRKGMIEKLPLPDASVDVVISNCVINLSPDKPRVFREAFRVLRPGGRLIVSDIVLNRPIPKEAAENEALHTACLAGALLRNEYLESIRTMGFRRIRILDDRAYSCAGDCAGTLPRRLQRALDGAASSVTILASKPRSYGSG